MAKHGKLLLKLGTQFNRKENASDENQESENENNNPNIILIAENVLKRLNFETDYDNNFEKTNEGR